MNCRNWLCKTILGAQVDEEAGITTVAAVELTAVSSASCFLHTAPAVSAFRAVQVFGILVIFQEMIEFRAATPFAVLLPCLLFRIFRSGRAGRFRIRHG